MENGSNLEQRAQSFSSDMQERLQLPEHVQLKQEYRALLGDDFYLELRAGSSTYNEGPDSRTMRYVYLQGPHGEVCRPLFALDLDQLIRTKEVEGLTWDAASISEALAVTDASLIPEIDLLETIRAVTESATVSDDGADKLNMLFIELLDKGTSVAIKSSTATHEDGTGIYAKQVAIEGDLAHVPPFFVTEPILEVRARRKNAELQTVFAEGRAGKFETYQQIANNLERAATYADPKDVHRDANGKVDFVMSDPRGALAVIAAERAMGLRDPKVEEFDFVEQYARELLIEQ